MKRTLFGTAAFSVLAVIVGFAPAVSAATHSVAQRGGLPHSSEYSEPLCTSHASLCADPYATPNGEEYVGHDEPSLEYKSGLPGSGNDMTYTVTLPRDPKQQPNASGAGGTTWNFQLRPTFWFGLTMCDSESAPEFTKTCTPDSDANNLVGTNPAAPDYIGKHPGNAYMELQFYGPGYVPQFEGFGCAATTYCAAMTIDSRTLDQNTGVENNADCNNYILGGPEPINWAYVTKSGVSQAPANPLFTGTFSAPNLSAVNPDYAKDLLMRPGDRIRIYMHDTPAGFRTDLTDLTTGQHGSMTASVANGFGNIQYQPNSPTCNVAPYAFHPEYSTANPRGNTWSAHTYNVAYSDEIGHFENCLAIDANFNCTTPGAQDQASGLDPDDGNSFCVPGTDSLLVKIDGCFSADGDWDGQSYQKDWPGTNPNPGQDKKLHPSPRHVHQPADRSRDKELFHHRLRGRPAQNRGVGLTGQPAVLRHDHRSELRQPAEWRPVLSLLHHERSPTAHARGRRAGTSSPEPRITSGGVQPRSSARSCRPSTRPRATPPSSASTTSIAVT